MINLDHVYLSYTKEFYNLFDVTMSVAKGKTTVVFGALESGKSSLLRVIAGFEQPTSGECTIDGVPSSKVDFKNDVAMGYLPQEGVFKENKTVYQNLVYPLRLRKVDKDISDIKVENALKGFELETLKDVPLRRLQAFDRCKVALARFSLRNIDVFVIDDVVSTVSADDAVTLAKYIVNLINNNGATAIIACSDAKMLKQFKGEVIKLEQGSITA